MTLWVRIAGIKWHKNVRVLLDCGSQRSYISESLVAELGLPIVSKENLALTLFGGSRTEPKFHNKHRIKLCSASPRACSSLEFEFLDQNVICGNIPRVSKGSILKELKRNNIWLSDMGADCPKIDILIDSDNYGKILTGQVSELKGGLMTFGTKLGWVVCGAPDEIISDKNRTAPTLCASLAVHDFNISDFWSLETIGILDANQNLSNVVEEEIASDQFLSSLTRKENGRYCVGLPWLGRSVELLSNYQVAEKILFGITRRLRSLLKYEKYDGVFKEWLEEGVIEMVPDRELNSKGHCLPHHPVFKPDSVTNKIRPVFDVSCKVGRSPSLNDCLVKGPNLTKEIPSILLIFREKCIGITSDIRPAFLQIELRKENRYSPISLVGEKQCCEGFPAHKAGIWSKV
ncbi:integrase catalytic domain-containing protein [Trichonephila inaurata madagascariensis]|uniref:Integrase catalytic domain-containing protein n=1 Tax=Trichonephila inaurata madagascariensis TaxID=2747483 RepID=A0A8X6MDP3_9ARAC|nr:integrase catalytic domain-containing protein [Trichonephila inaurata madagascariensis]